MDRANTPVPGLISSLEAMIDASVSAALDRRFGFTADLLSVQVDAAVASALDLRLGIGGVDLENHIETSVARAVSRRFGPLGSVISAQIVLGAPQSPVPESTQSNHTIVPQTTPRALSSTAPRDPTTLQDLPHDIELANAQLEGLDGNDGEIAVDKMAIEHDLPALQERYTGAVASINIQQQQGPNTFGAPVAEEDAGDLKLKEDLQEVGKEAMGYVLLARSSLPAENKIPPHDSTLGTIVQILEASTTKRECSAKHVGISAQTRLAWALEVERADYARDSNPQDTKLRYVETSTEQLPDIFEEAEESLFVKTEELDHSTRLSPRKRTPGSMEKIFTILPMDEHSESLSKSSYIAAEDGNTFRETIASGSAGASQLSAAGMADEGVREVIPFTRREIEAPKNGRLLSGEPSPRPMSLPQIDFAALFRSSSEGNSVPLKEQSKGLSGVLGDGHSQKSPSLREAPQANALRKCSTPTDSNQTASTEAEKLLSMEKGRTSEAPTKLEKRKASTPANAAEALAETDENEAPPKKKRAKVNPPGYTEGPSIRFLKVCSQLTARTKGGRGHPRVVDLESFTKHSNKQTFTMADIVATILWNHKPESLKAFLDIEPSFSFVRKEGDKKRRNFAIERREEGSGTMVTVSGFDYFTRMLGLTHPSRSATMLEAPVISGLNTTSIPSKEAEGGIQSGTRWVPLLPLSTRERSRKQQ